MVKKKAYIIKICIYECIEWHYLMFFPVTITTPEQKKNISVGLVVQSDRVLGRCFACAAARPLTEPTTHSGSISVPRGHVFDSVCTVPGEFACICVLPLTLHAIRRV